MSLQSLIDRPVELLELINDYLKPKEKEKKEYGEVFTPISLINDMLDKLPENIWTNKDLKWFDPASGMGNFSIAVYLRLMNSLKQEIIDDQERKKHILENMLYMSELNKKNVLICKQIFDINNNYKLNIHQGNTLKTDFKQIFGIEQFDIILGNPPYQDNQKNTGKRGGGNLLWNKFIIMSLNILNKNGYLLFIHPAGWRKPESDKSKYKNLYNLMTRQHQLLYLEIHDSKDGMKIFKCGTRYDWYIIENKQKYKNTIIKGDDDKIYDINLDKWNFIPNSMYDVIEKLIKNNQDEGCEVIFSISSYETRKKWVSTST